MSFPVVDGNRPVGLILLRAASVLVRSGSGRAADHMITLDRAPTLSPDQPASDALAELARSELGSALVSEGERLVGLVSISDLGRVLELRTAEGKAARAALAGGMALGGRPANAGGVRSECFLERSRGGRVPEDAQRPPRSEWRWCTSLTCPIPKPPRGGRSTRLPTGRAQSTAVRRSASAGRRCSRLGPAAV
jgi:hypothetical protein